MPLYSCSPDLKLVSTSTTLTTTTASERRHRGGLRTDWKGLLVGTGRQSVSFVAGSMGGLRHGILGSLQFTLGNHVRAQVMSHF